MLAHGIAETQPFLDGNKRLALLYLYLSISLSLSTRDESGLAGEPLFEIAQ